MPEVEPKPPWAHKILASKFGLFIHLCCLVATAVISSISSVVGTPDKYCFWFAGTLTLAAGFLLGEHRKKIESWHKDKRIQTVQQASHDKEVKLNHVYSKPFWQLKSTLKKKGITGTLEDYLDDMSRTCQEIISGGRAEVSKLRTTIYQLDRAPMETDDGNDEDESTREENVLTCVCWDGRPDRPRASYRESNLKDNYTITTLLEKEGKERELFHPNFEKYPIPGLSLEEMQKKSYRGFYGVPILDAYNDGVLGMLTIDCEEPDCFTEDDRPLLRHLASMVSLGFMGSKDGQKETVIVHPPKTLQLADNAKLVISRHASERIRDIDRLVFSPQSEIMNSTERGSS